MAKAVKGGGMSRIRFVMLDAEIPDGDLSQITQAIQNALKPAVMAQQRLSNGAGTKAIAHDLAEPPVVDELVEEEFIEDTPPLRQPRVKRTVAKMPKVIPIDMNADVSLAAFASDKDSGSQAKKYMISAAWLKEHRAIDAVTENHIYTCFKSMDWSTNIPNFAQPLRDLKAKQQYFEKSDKGYEINHIGIDFVKKLTRKGD